MSSNSHQLLRENTDTPLSINKICQSGDPNAFSEIDMILKRIKDDVDRYNRSIAPLLLQNKRIPPPDPRKFRSFDPTMGDDINKVAYEMLEPKPRKKKHKPARLLHSILPKWEGDPHKTEEDQMCKIYDHMNVPGCSGSFPIMNDEFKLFNSSESYSQLTEGQNYFQFVNNLCYGNIDGSICNTVVIVDEEHQLDSTNRSDSKKAQYELKQNRLCMGQKEHIDLKKHLVKIKKKNTIMHDVVDSNDLLLSRRPTRISRRAPSVQGFFEILLSRKVQKIDYYPPMDIFSDVGLPIPPEIETFWMKTKYRKKTNIKTTEKITKSSLSSSVPVEIKADNKVEPNVTQISRSINKCELNMMKETSKISSTEIKEQCLDYDRPFSPDKLCVELKKYYKDIPTDSIMEFHSNLIKHMHELRDGILANKEAEIAAASVSLMEDEQPEDEIEEESIYSRQIESSSGYQVDEPRVELTASDGYNMEEAMDEFAEFFPDYSSSYRNHNSFSKDLSEKTTDDNINTERMGSSPNESKIQPKYSFNNEIFDQYPFTAADSKVVPPIGSQE